MTLRNWIAPILCVAGAQQLLALDCVDAQKQVLTLSPENTAQLVVENLVYDQQDAFVNSKPALKGTSITTGSFTTAGDYQQLWCKLKSQEAVLAETKWKPAGPPADCASLNRLQAEAALQDLGLDASLESLGFQFLADKDFSTGSQWAPSSVGIVQSFGAVTVQAMRLKSPNWLPVIGGMNYCKILSADGAKQLIQERLQTSRDHRTQTIEWPAALGSKQTALLWLHGDLDEALDTAKGTMIISPGAEIPPAAMSGLADELTNRGYLTLIVQYPNNTAILDNINGRGNSAINLAKKLKQAPADIKGFDALRLKGKPVYVLGHSLGGATLADEVYHNKQASIFDHIFLYGTASFVKLLGKVPTSSPVTLLFGENDGLSQNDIPGVLKNFAITYDPTIFTPVFSSPYPNVSTQRLKGLNHFCIISDQSVGNASLKKKDGAGLEPEACIDALVQALGI